MSNEDANAYTRSWSSREVSLLTRRVVAFNPYDYPPAP